MTLPKDGRDMSSCYHSVEYCRLCASWQVSPYWDGSPRSMDWKRALSIFIVVSVSRIAPRTKTAEIYNPPHKRSYCTKWHMYTNIHVYISLCHYKSMTLLWILHISSERISRSICSGAIFWTWPGRREWRTLSIWQRWWWVLMAVACRSGLNTEQKNARRSHGTLLSSIFIFHR